MPAPSPSPAIIAGRRRTKRSGTAMRAMRSMPASEAMKSPPMPSSTTWPTTSSYGSRYEREKTSRPLAKISTQRR